MTDAQLGNLGRETLLANAGSVQLDNLVREALLSGVTPVLLGSLVRETLLYSTAIAMPYQYAVTVTT